VHLVADWLDYQESVAPVVARLIQALQAEKSAQPDDDFARGHHREQPWRRRLQALLFAPRLGIDTLTAFATHEHPLQTRVGRGYQSATLRQLLGQLERIDAATALLPALGPPQEGQVT
jgi:hypothetical protein